MIRYTITADNPKAHLLNITLDIESPSQPVQHLRLPNWIPGSYLIRDFAKNILNLRAVNQQGAPIKIDTIDKSNWRFTCTESVTVNYQVYAWDLSVRSAHFDETHAFFNGTSTFLEVVNQSKQPCEVTILNTDIDKQNNWKVATGMPSESVDENGFGTYRAESYPALIDYPVEISDFEVIEFEANEIPHKMVLTGVFQLDKDRLKNDLIKICETELNLFGAPAPIDNYLFQVMVTGNDYGGLEHRNSTALICGRNDLPYPGMQDASEGYLKFLELCSHEYFHTWNVKRIQPKVFQNADLQNPVYTNQLWWFEGITSYYDSLILLRAGLIDKPTYLSILAKQMTRVYRMPGRFEQSVAESSWLTWTKFYQQNENAPNAIISYYTKGSLIALGLDLIIRQQTNSEKSLDDVLLHLWQHYGSTGKGLNDGEIEAICSQVSGVDFTHFFEQYLFGTHDLPFTELFKPFGIHFDLTEATSLNDLGGMPRASQSLATTIGANLSTLNNGLKLTHVWNNQPAWAAGLASGDIIIALNTLQVTNSSQVEQILKRALPGERVTCHYFRRDELRETELVLQAPPKDRVSLSVAQSTELDLVTKWIEVGRNG